MIYRVEKNIRKAACVCLDNICKKKNYEKINDEYAKKLMAATMDCFNNHKS
jgi:hypothetical protein